MKKNTVFFRKITKSMVIVTDQLLETRDSNLHGFAVKVRTQNQVRFGILCLRDPETDQPLREGNPLFQKISAKLLKDGPGHAITGFKFSDAPVLNEDNEPTGLWWVEAV